MFRNFAIAAVIACGSVALCTLPSQAGTLTFNSEVDVSDPLFDGFANIDLTPFSVDQDGVYSFDVNLSGYTLADSFAFLLLQGSPLNSASVLAANDDDGSSLESFFFANLVSGTNYVFGVRGFAGGLGTYEATIAGPGNINTPTQAIPTPALLPGLIGMGAMALRKRKAAAEESANEA